MMESSACSILFDSCWRMIEVQRGLMLDSWKALRQPTDWGYCRWGCSWGMPPLDRSSFVLRRRAVIASIFMRLSTSEPLLSMRKNDKYMTCTCMYVHMYEESCPVLAVFTRGVQV